MLSDPNNKEPFCQTQASGNRVGTVGWTTKGIPDGDYRGDRYIIRPLTGPVDGPVEGPVEGPVMGPLIS